MKQEKKAKNLFSRRNVMIGGLATAGAITLAKKPRDLSGDSIPYFEDLQTAVKRAGIGKPTLIIDRQRLHENIDAVTDHLPKGMALRIAQKSVPSMGLLNEILTQAKTNRLMVFNKDYLQAMCLEKEYKQILLGKPLPITAVSNFYEYIASHTPNEESLNNLEWLIDSPARLHEYQNFAEVRGIDLNINIELNVGMERGGIADQKVLADALRKIDAHPQLTFSGFMGYEKHIVYALGGAGAQEKAKLKCWAKYREAVATAQAVLGSKFDANTATLNGGGSATYRLYKDTKTMNDLCLGSAFVMPSHFDFETLSDHKAASFIAAPVLKQSYGLNLPGGGILNNIFEMWDPNQRQSFFQYGGRWLADPVYPQGLVYNKLFGQSSNQDFLTGSKHIDLKPNDHIILRPQESEALFLQFGDIAVYENGEISEFWPVLPAAP